MIDIMLDSKIPDSFVVEMPEFNGQPAYKFTVEIYKNVKELSIDFWLESNELDQMVDSYINATFREIVERHKNLALILRK